MSLPVEEMNALLVELKMARYSGALRVKFRERDITYKSDAEMAKAIRALEDEINGNKVKTSSSLAVFGSGL